MIAEHLAQRETNMKKLKIALVAAGTLQIIPGLDYALMPQTMLAWMGHSSIAPQGEKHDRA